MQTTTGACPLREPDPLKQEGAAKKMVRRIVQQVAPTLARVRYDVAHNRWAVLDDRNNVLRHFEYGYMTDAKFKAETVRVGAGCGSSTSTVIGVATGMLRENTYGANPDNWDNLSFDGHQFNGPHGAITQAKKLILMPNRRSVYK